MTNNKKNKKEEIKERLKKKIAQKNTEQILDDNQFELLKNELSTNDITNQIVKQENNSTKIDGRTKLFVCTPCYCGNVHVKYMKSIMNLQLFCIQNNIGFEFYTIPFDSLIPRARNACVTRFMQSKDSTHLIFIDADIEFNPMNVAKMIKENKDVIGGIYSKKALDFKRLSENFSKTKNELELLQSAGRYAFNFKKKEKHQIVNGVVEVLDAPTGFLMIKKQVFEKMIIQYPEKEYKNDVAPYNVKEDDKFYDFFPSQIFTEEDGVKRYLSEDYGFCRLWQQMGGEIYADLTVQLNHIGQFTYAGNPMQYLQNTPGVSVTKNN